jgi:hypothetical protein
VFADTLLFLVRLVIAMYVSMAKVAGGFLLLFLPLVIFGALPGWLFPWPGITAGFLGALALTPGEFQKNEETQKLALATRASTSNDELPSLLVLRSPDDEASRGMRAGQTSGRLLLVAWTAFDAFFKLGRAWWRVALVLVASFMVGVIGVAGWPIPTTAPVDAIRHPVTTLFEGFTNLYIGVAIGVVATGLIAAMPLAVALGPELLRVPLVVNPVVEDMPSGIRIRAMNLPGTGFRHQVYSRPEAAEQVARFINEIGVVGNTPTAIAS